MGFKKFQVWDSDMTWLQTGQFDERNIEPIRAEFRKVAGSIILAKIIPCTFFFNNPVYPVYTDTESTFHPQPSGEETETVDGHTRLEDQTATWAGIRDGDGNNSLDTSATSNAATIEMHSTTDRFRQGLRGIFLFDTSLIGVSEDVTAAIFSFEGSAKTDNFNQGIVLTSSSPTSNVAVASGDYELMVGATLQSDTTIDITSYSTSAYNDWTLNATGRSNVAKGSGGVTKLGLQISADQSNTDLTAVWASNEKADGQGRFAETANQTSDPKLVVTHVAGVAADTTIIIISKFFKSLIQSAYAWST